LTYSEKEGRALKKFYYSVYRIYTGLVEAMRKPCGSLMSAAKLFDGI
jgi:hypothetical protein